MGRTRDLLPARDTWQEPDLNGAALEELIALAHERGHELSEHRKLYVPDSIEEEHRGWDHAREILDRMGFVEWEVFAHHEGIALAGHDSAGTGK